MSIQECIHIFFQHLESLEVHDKNENDGYTREFKEIVYRSKKWIYDSVYPSLNGEMSVNIPKNRYKDILPFDHSRVILPTIDGIEGSDYINANYILGAAGKNSYIAAQGPQPATVHDFWRMLWHFKITVVVMVCNEYEGIKFKCQRYWPEKGKEAVYHNDTIKISMVEEQEYREYVVRVLQVTCGDEVRLIYQLHYLAWPDHGTPTAIEPILDMLAYARRYQPHDKTPIVIHCSAGCGRTGTVIALDYTWSLLKLGKLRLDYSIYKLILNFRTQRPSLVQSDDQYLFVYLAVKELFQRHLTLIEEHFYENVDSAKKESPANRCIVTGNDEGTYEEVQVVPHAKAEPKPSYTTPTDFNNKTSAESTPTHNKTLEIPTLRPVPPKRNSKETDSGTLKGPPKAQRVFSMTDSPTDTTIRNTLSRLYSSCSETDTDVSRKASVTPPRESHAVKIPDKPNKLLLSNVQKSPTNAPKPLLSPKPPKPATVSPLKPAYLPPERAVKRNMNAERNRIGGLVSSEKSSSLDEIENERTRIGSSNSDSSSVNTVFTSDKGSSSAVSDISVFSAENLTIEQNHSNQLDYKTDAKHNTLNALSASKEDNLHINVDKHISEDSAQAQSDYVIVESVSSAHSKPKLQFEFKSQPNVAPLPRKSDSHSRNIGNNKDTSHTLVQDGGLYSDANSAIGNTPNLEYSEATNSNGISDHSEYSKATACPDDAASSAIESYRVDNSFVRRERDYASIEDIALDEPPEAESGMDPVDAYAYAGNVEGNKWSLQHIALGKPAQQRKSDSPSLKTPAQSLTSSVTSGVGTEYSEAQASEVFSSSDEEGPAIPKKNYDVSELEELKSLSLSSHSQGSTGSLKTSEDHAVYNVPVKYQQLPPSGTLGRVFGKKFGLKKSTSRTETSNITHLSAPATVMYKGKDISFGNRVGRPVGGRSNALFEPKH